ncbi:MAG: choice-of-anchor W domain-containing protein [Scytonema sp. PMC 1069.18]|nr:choice-of-anchor W domain-containing protein [Scytonema sp. PMC 1069.18]MEC4888018.1 choice-of-anchor W domain-containing protein [Scytonema sp. PMC 1070.18]
MKQHKLLLILGLASLGLLTAPNPAKAFTLVDRTGFTDTDFENLRKNGEFSELFVAEGRIGDRSGAGTYELSINNASGTPVEERQFNWLPNTLVDFSLEYTGNEVTYTVGDRTLTSTALTGSISDIFLRTYAQKDGLTSPDNQNNFVQLSNIQLYENGSNVGQTITSLASSGTATNSDTDYIQLSNISSGFKLTGQTLFNWEGTAPTFSNLAYQIKVGNTTPKSVPEPGTVGAILLTTVISVGYGKTKKLKSKQN